jgi:hypothetical protein
MLNEIEAKLYISLLLLAFWTIDPYNSLIDGFLTLIFATTVRFKMGKVDGSKTLMSLCEGLGSRVIKISEQMLYNCKAILVTGC